MIKYQTVAQIIEYLQEFSPDAEVKFITEPFGSANFWLSSYPEEPGLESDKDALVICVDIGKENE